jgi:glycerol uptake facilitator-like aquaporin
MKLSRRVREVIGAAIGALVVTFLAYPSVLKIERSQGATDCEITAAAPSCS